MKILAKQGWDKSPSLSIIFGLSQARCMVEWVNYADFISFYSPITDWVGGGDNEIDSNELPISCPTLFLLRHYAQ